MTTHLIINTTLAGVAQSVERVALINSKEINLKVVGSSPTFGYSYIKVFPCGSSCSFALFGRILFFLAGRCLEVDGRRLIDVVSRLDVSLLRGWVERMG